MIRPPVQRNCTGCSIEIATIHPDSASPAGPLRHVAKGAEVNRRLHIAVLDDDRDQCELIGHWLEQEDIDYQTFGTATELFRAIREQAFNLFLIDWELPDLNGPAVLSRLRGSLKITAPVLFITARSAESDVERVLEAGAEDYLVKPLKPRELLARIRARARQAGVALDGSDVLERHDLVLDRSDGSVSLGEQAVSLSAREFNLLWLLASRMGTPVSREQILAEVWGHTQPIATRTVDTHVSRLRSKLDLKANENWKLSGVSGVGYKLEHA